MSVDFTNQYIVLYELNYVDADGNPQVLRAGSRGYNHPSAPAYYPGHATSRITISEQLFSNPLDMGVALPNVGQLQLVNPQGQYDALLDSHVAGYPARVLFGSIADDYADFQELVSGAVDLPRITTDKIEISWRDRSGVLDRPVQRAQYAGDNVAPDGYEGGTDLADKYKPLVLGTVRNIPAVMVNSSKYIFEVSASMVDVLAVYDNGVELDAGTTYGALSSFSAAAVTPGTYDLYRNSETTLIKVASLTGTLTVDATDGKNGGEIFQYILIEAGEIPSSDDAAAWTVAAGLYAGTEQRTVRECLDTLARSAGGSIYHDGSEWRLHQLALPDAGTPVVATLRGGDKSMVLATDEIQILDLEIVHQSAERGGVPVRGVAVQYDRNHTIQTTDQLAGSVQDRADYTTQEYRTARVVNAGVEALEPLAPEPEITTALVEQGDAAALAARLCSLWSGARMYKAQAWINTSGALDVRMGDVVEIFHPRFGVEAGRKVIVVGREYTGRNGLLQLTMWG